MSEVVGDRDWLMWQCVLAPGVCLDDSAGKLMMETNRSCHGDAK
ncbi:hypothetical protein COLO4_07482 [Corchorus olitorius]|uniref:Uncharacterized protein n=1 Tax=Corchorus olitorius TaxID=93759 RepID=A0A1R3KJK7_9ROSI|nr:hypothetical protein COLO4_07482 [Corchorus olitorius]